MPLLFLQGCIKSNTKEQESLTQIGNSPASYVDPFVGTGGHGHTYPGATVPFGMVQLSPDNGTQGWDWCSGYHYSDSIIAGFSHTHLSGTGIGDLCDISVMPVTGKVDWVKNPSKDSQTYASLFSHDDESASPGYYAVYLKDYDIQAALTATKRAGFHQYIFPASKEAAIIFNLGFAINWDSPTETYIKVENDSTISGYRKSSGWAEDQRVFFAAAFSKPFKTHSLAVDENLLNQETEAKGRLVKAKFNFDTKQDEAVYLKVAISSASVDAAKKSLSEEIPAWDFDKTREQAYAHWDNVLNKIHVTSDNDTLKKTFYTALYHTKLAPVLYSDSKSEYKGADGQVHKAEGFDRYAIFSLWDTFRAAQPLFTILEGDRVNDMIRSLLSHYKQYGFLPVWELLGNETNTMTGYHAIPVIVDAYLKGYRDYDVETAYEAMKKSAMQDIRGVNFYKEFGYIPSDMANESVTKTLEYAYDDWCIAQMAKALGKEEDHQYFLKRANSYQLLFDTETGFMRGKNRDGSWRTPFDPKHSSHRENTDYTEGNAWQHSWFVPHDVAGLIALHGGSEPFISMLDSLFSEDSMITGENISPDISGLIGQYAHGNEPSHHIAYLYNYAGAPWKTQEKVQQIMAAMYKPTPDGISGNEDCGQMSAWYVFSAMGFYPVNPASGIYVLGSPLFSEISIDVGNGKKFELIAKNKSAKNIYIQSATLNGKPLNRSYITHDEVMNGDKVTLEMGPQPNMVWGRDEENIPPSIHIAI